MPCSRRGIRLSLLDDSRVDAALRVGAEELTHQHCTTLSAIGRAALSVAIDAPQLMKPSLLKTLAWTSHF
jgi:hypothetical protein